MNTAPPAATMRGVRSSPLSSSPSAGPGRRRRFLASLAGASLLLGADGCSRPRPAGGPPSLLPAWELAAKQLVPDAQRELPEADAFHTDADRRADGFARALLLLNAQPKTRANVAEAGRLLEALRADAGPEDPVGRRAAFALARIAQWHVSPPDPARAAALYAQLAAGADPLAQAARVQGAQLRLFGGPAIRNDADLRARLSALEPEADAFTDPPARRDFHLLMADGYRELADPPAEADLLRHLLAAEAAGVRRRQARLGIIAEIGELARRLGQRDVAAAHFRAFLAISSRDLRTAVIRHRLEELDATPPP